MTVSKGNLADILTISIVSHGHGDMLKALMRDLNIEINLIRVRVILTLNIPDRPIRQNEYPNLDILIIYNQYPKGFGANHNYAFSLTRTPWFIVLNPDTRIADQEPFTGLLTEVCDIGDLGVAAPAIINSSGTREDAVRLNITPLSLIRRIIFGQRNGLDVDYIARRGEKFYWLAGMCLLVRSSAFKAVGGFDERFFLYLEDFDLSARMYIAGYAVASIDAVSIVHDAQRGSHRSFHLLRRHVASQLRMWLSKPFWTLVLMRS